ncbi:hypothetical protein Ahy_B09g095908 isoform A [Arachis hypogaea]|uniref:Uncharacterized protein n=1 Tax=Arachis hypogaea TaxID=3818 RepID=A0A444XH57_ARAHY|nr:hypothetical protein Ahy_B09g095908 isoform A [Arachis hypogaea]
MSFFLSPSTSFFHRCRYSSRCMISLCHPLRCTSSLLVVLLLRFLSHAGISKLMRRCGMVVGFYASCFLTVSQSSTATTLRWCFSLNMPVALYRFGFHVSYLFVSLFTYLGLVFT